MAERLALEKLAYLEFLRLLEASHFESQRTGQAFYNHFNLHRLSDQQALAGLYAADGRQAIKLIERMFDIE
ncbi:hypothetical protein [Pseudomonas sp. PAMC 26793]|jgi:hypothetical protein|uniref:hypothetical protein n=1 Tax=Pseudomonas TaxID=286 RepID=UPI000306591A|nr:hypothetical protein [Pseudomonas sp. PAMC 26793]